MRVKGGLPALKCGRKSDYHRSSVPALRWKLDVHALRTTGASTNKGNGNSMGSAAATRNNYFLFPPTHPGKGARAAQAGRSAAGSQRSFLPFPGTPVMNPI
jgi:hypothetical protein